MLAIFLILFSCYLIGFWPTLGLVVLTVLCALILSVFVWTGQTYEDMSVRDVDRVDDEKR